MTNKKLGNEFENELAEKLDDQGFWVHLLNQNKSGQPADIIAVKNQKAFLIDAKVCSDNKFQTSRIEENQKLAMQKWSDCGNKEGWFALKVDSGIYMIPYFILEYLVERKSVLSHNDIRTHGYDFDIWVKIHE